MKLFTAVFWNEALTALHSKYKVQVNAGVGSGHKQKIWYLLRYNSYRKHETPSESEQIAENDFYKHGAPSEPSLLWLLFPINTMLLRSKNAFEQTPF